MSGMPFAIGCLLLTQNTLGQSLPAERPQAVCHMMATAHTRHDRPQQEPIQRLVGIEMGIDCAHIRAPGRACKDASYHCPQSPPVLTEVVIGILE
jgi:hypothetical protein